MWCVVGLGNPGRRYKHTRHNAGFLVVETLCERFRCSRKRKTRLYEVRGSTVQGVEILLARPLTFMNLSGLALGGLAADYEIPIEEFLVICDDAWLPSGKIRLRKKGSSGGHQGLQSIVDTVSSETFHRLRIGIGMPPIDENLEDYVLSRPSRAEREGFQNGIARAAEAVVTACVEGFDVAMGRYN